jgi:valyl-tRNA synthetase
MGHLLNQTLQDVFTRRARHSNACATWIPGTDHAGISLQVMVEKELKKKGIEAKKIGRKKFLEHAREWRDRYGGVILKQLESLGVSCDFKNCVHTLDEDYSRCVLTMFVELYRRGYVYRGRRMINWCPATGTAISDEEVTMRPQKSKLYYVRYEIIEKPGTFIEIATTRPETIMGDVAVAVNQDDDRHIGLIGLHCRRPLNPAPIEIIADSAVDKKFGTGVLKITPAHDGIDFDIGRRHNLPIIDVLNGDGTMNANAGPEFAGLDRFVARDMAGKKLEEIGALVKIEDYENSIGFSERGQVPIEPRLSDQWFLRYPKVDEAKRAVSRGFIKFYPKRWEKTYLHWLDNIQDWCISRQLWWGHRIPVWYRKNADRNDSGNWHVSIGGPTDPENWEQDEDVLDTWASSWAWPFGVFGWPDEGKMMKRHFPYFYPTSVLVTGPDIIFFWVARMIIAGLEFVGPEKKTLSDVEIAERIPFRRVHFTGIIRDAMGRKMSKSLGNSPEPLDLIGKYGADGLRLGILMSAPCGQDLIFQEENLELGRNFCNKLWNAFRLSRIGRNCKAYTKLELADLISVIDQRQLDVDDHAILLELVNFCGEFERHFDNSEIHGAIGLVSTFFWDSYCNWYAEASKERLKDGNASVCAVHGIVIRQLLLILNPFVPFITEELWNVGESDQCSMQCTYCETAKDLGAMFLPLNLDIQATDRVAKFQELLSSARRLIAKSTAARDEIALHIMPRDGKSKLELAAYMPKMKRLLAIDKVDLIDEVLQMPPAQSALGTIFLEFEKADSGAERQRIEREIKKISDLINLNEVKLSNKSFLENAPDSVVAGARKMLRENVEKRNELVKILASL